MALTQASSQCDDPLVLYLDLEALDMAMHDALIYAEYGNAEEDASDMAPDFDDRMRRAMLAHLGLRCCPETVLPIVFMVNKPDRRQQKAVQIPLLIIFDYVNAAAYVFGSPQTRYGQYETAPWADWHGDVYWNYLAENVLGWTTVEAKHVNVWTGSWAHVSGYWSILIIADGTQDGYDHMTHMISAVTDVFDRGLRFSRGVEHPLRPIIRHCPNETRQQLLVRAVESVRNGWNYSQSSQARRREVRAILCSDWDYDQLEMWANEPLFHGDQNLERLRRLLETFAKLCARRGCRMCTDRGAAAAAAAAYAEEHREEMDSDTDLATRRTAPKEVRKLHRNAHNRRWGPCVHIKPMTLPFTRRTGLVWKRHNPRLDEYLFGPTLESTQPYQPWRENFGQGQLFQHSDWSIWTDYGYRLTSDWNQMFHLGHPSDHDLSAHFMPRGNHPLQCGLRDWRTMRTSKFLHTDPEVEKQLFDNDRPPAMTVDSDDSSENVRSDILSVQKLMFCSELTV